MRTLARMVAILLAAASAAAGADWIELLPGRAPGAHPEVRVLASDPRATLMEIVVPGYWAEADPAGWHLELPGRLLLSEAGSPALPLVGCTLVLPAPDSPAPRLLSADFRPTPVPRARISAGPAAEGAPQAGGNARPDPTSGLFPPEPARVAHTGLWRDVPLATVQIHPFRARRDGTGLEAASRLVVEVVHAGAPRSWPTPCVPPSFRPWLERAVVNPGVLQGLPVSPLSQGPEYLVLSPPALAGAVQPLLDWRGRQGYRTELISLAANDPNAVKGLILSRFLLGGLLHVVLVGDQAEIPSFTWSGLLSDSWFACLTGAPIPDLYPDVGLGRLSGSTPQAIRHQVDRILAYEIKPPAGAWCEQALLVAHGENGPAGLFTASCEKIAAGPISGSGWTIKKQYGHASGVDNFSLAGLIDAGAGLVLYRGHGAPTEWIGWCNAGSFTDQHVLALKNGAMNPIVLSIGCLTGQLATPTCFTEAWLRAGSGATAALGATDTTYTQGNDPFALEMTRALFQGRTANLYGFYASGILEALKAGHPAGTATALSFCWLGDPCTNLWLARPQTLTVSHQASIKTGAQRIELTVSGPGGPLAAARACLSKMPELFQTAATDANGKAFFSVSPATTGSILVTVTAPDHLPYLGTIQVTGAGGPLAVIPDGLEAKEGSGSCHLPCRHAPSRSQHLYDASILAGLKSGTIQTLRMRRDGRSPNVFEAHAFDLTVHMSSKGVPAARGWSRQSYRANQGSDWALVLPAATVHFAAEPLPAAPPAPFSVLLPLAQPFPYENGRNLLVQFDATDRPGGKGDYFWLADGEEFSGPGGLPGTWAPFGSGCPPGGLLIASIPPVAGIDRLAFSWYSGAGFGVPALGIIGTSDKTWGPLSLPFPLAVFGAPGCQLYADWALALPGTTDPSGAPGRFRVEAPVPHDPVLAGARLFAQSFVFERSFNAAGLMASEGLRISLGGYAPPPAALQLYTYNEAPPFPDTPKFYLHAGLVLEIGM